METEAVDTAAVYNMWQALLEDGAALLTELKGQPATFYLLVAILILLFVLVIKFTLFTARTVWFCTWYFILIVLAAAVAVVVAGIKIGGERELIDLWETWVK